MEIILGLVIFVLDIIAVVKILGGSGSAGHKILWILLIFFLPLLGLILWFFLGRK